MPLDPELARVVTAWPLLPVSLRRAVLALIHSAADVAGPAAAR